MEKLKELFSKIYNSNDLKNHQYDELNTTIYHKFSSGYGYIQQDISLIK